MSTHAAGRPTQPRGPGLGKRAASWTWDLILGRPHQAPRVSGAGETGGPGGGPVSRPGPRGWAGRGAGSSAVVEPAAEWRGTTVQVCGLWPFGVGSGTPVVGVPLGRHLITGATVCADPISWHRILIRNPSMFLLGLPGLGKSTLIRRMVLGLMGFGTVPLVLGDLRPDYVDLVRELGGDVISLGGSRGYLNPLDMREAAEAAARIVGAARDAERAGDEREAARLFKIGTDLLEDAKTRRATLVCALIAVQRGTEGGVVRQREETLVAAALEVLDAQHPQHVPAGGADGAGAVPPVLEDLLRVVQEPPELLRSLAVDRGDLGRYQDATEDLESSLIGLVHGGRLGRTFSQQTSAPMRRDRAVVFDLSGIQEAQPALRGAALMACWSTGFGAVNVAQALAHAGLEPQRHYFIVMDEIHQALRAGSDMVERFDRLTRLNRKDGVGQVMCTHTMKDLSSLPTEEDREKARGLVERAGMVVLGGLPGAEMPLLTRVVELSGEEQGLLSKWQTPPSWDPDAGAEAAPPGQGNFLIKVGGRAGIPFQVRLTAVERARGVNDTNKLWATQSRLGHTQPTAQDARAVPAVDFDALEAEMAIDRDRRPDLGPDGLGSPWDGR